MMHTCQTGCQLASRFSFFVPPPLSDFFFFLTNSLFARGLLSFTSSSHLKCLGAEIVVPRQSDKRGSGFFGSGFLELVGISLL